MSMEFWGSLAASVIIGICAYAAAEMTRRYAAGKRDGEMDTKATLLATAFGEFKVDTKKSFDDLKVTNEKARQELKDDFQRIYDCIDRHPCHQEGAIGAIQADLKSHWARLDRIDARVHELENMSAIRRNNPESIHG